MSKPIGTVLTYGTFGLFHVGHVRLLRRLADLGETLIVACSTDEFNAIKGKQTAIAFKHRVEVVESCRYVDQVIAEDNWEQNPTTSSTTASTFLRWATIGQGNLTICAICATVFPCRAPKTC